MLRTLCVVAVLAVAAAADVPTFAAGRTHLPSGQRRFIVKFRQSADRVAPSSMRSSSISAAGAHRIADNPRHNWSVVTANTRALNALRRDRNVEYVEEDLPVYPLGLRAARKLPTTSSWGLADIGGPFTVDSPKVVCVIDSGVNVAHQDINNPNFFGPTSGQNSPSGSLPWNTDGCDHGTHVSGTIAATNDNDVGIDGVVRVTSETPFLYTVRVFADNCNWAYTSALISAMEACASIDNIAVISMSLGRGGGESTSEREAIEEMVGNGIFITAAAGNSGDTSKSYPGSYDAVVSVAAHSSSGSIASFSQRNDQVDISAPGVGVPSTVGSSSGVSFYSGTSMATPHVGACALVLMSEVPNATPADVKNSMYATADDSSTPTDDANGRDDSFGHGRLQCAAALQHLRDTLAPPEPPATAPVLDAAATVATGPRAMFAQWSAVADADDYVVRVNDGAADTDFDAAGTSLSLDADPETTYAISVAGRNAGGVGPFSAPVSVTTPALPLPPQTAPVVDTDATAATGPDSIFAQWSAVADADDYVVRVNDGAADTDFDAAGTSLSLDADPETTYAISVAGRNAGGVGPFSAPVSVTTPEGCNVAAPTVSAPAVQVLCSEAGSTATVQVELGNQDTVACGESNFALAAEATADVQVDFGEGNDIPTGATTEVTVRILTDRYPQETSWKIIDAERNTVDGISRRDLDERSTEYLWKVDLQQNNGDYKFLIFDSARDGLCCHYGEGEWELFLGDNETPVASGAEFGRRQVFTITEASLGSGTATGGSFTNAFAVAGASSAQKSLTITIPEAHEPSTTFSVPLYGFRDEFSSTGDADATATLTVMCQAPTPPDAPTGLALTAGTPAASAIDAAWTSDAPSFAVQYRVKDSGVEWTDASEDATADNPYTISGLEPLTTYEVRVVAISEFDVRSDPSAVAELQTALGAPQAPVIDTLTAGVDGMSLAVEWSHESVAGTQPEFFDVYVRVSGAADFPADPAATEAFGATTAALSGLTPGTSYDVIVVARNAAGSSPPSNVATEQTPLVCVPGAVTVQLDVDQGTDAMALCSKFGEISVTVTVTNTDTVQCDASTFDVSLDSVPAQYKRCQLVDLHITPDDFPAETSFALYQGTTAAGTPVASGQAGSASLELCAAPNALDFLLVVADSAGDGLCCTFGDGAVSVSVGGEVVRSLTGADATFTTELPVDFALAAGAQVTVAPQESETVVLKFSTQGSAPGANPVTVGVAHPTEGTTTASADTNLQCVV